MPSSDLGGTKLPLALTWKNFCLKSEVEHFANGLAKYADQLNSKRTGIGACHISWAYVSASHTRGNKFLNKSSFQVRAGPVKGQKQGRDEKTQEHYLVRNDGGLLSGLQCNAIASRSLVHFVVCKVNKGCKCIALRPERTAPLFRSIQEEFA